MTKNMPAKPLDHDRESFTKRFKQLTKEVGGVTRLAKITGIKRPSARKYTEGTDPSRSALSKIVSNLDVDPIWLLTGKYQNEHTKGVNKLTRSGSSREHSDIVEEIPVFDYTKYLSCLLEVFDFNDRDSAMSRLQEMRETLPTIAFDRRHIEAEFPQGIDHIYCYVMEDNSMFPDIPKGSKILIDTSKNKVSPGRTHLVRYDDSPIVRKVDPSKDPSAWDLVGNEREAVISLSKKEIIESGAILGLAVEVTHKSI
jgi:hypothetical protein